MTSISDQIAGLSPERRRLLEKLLREEQGAALSSLVILPRQETGLLPLSPAQGRMWYLDSLSPGNPALHISAAVRLEGELDALALEAAFDAILRRHAVLRAAFFLAGDQPVCEIQPEPALQIHRVDLRDLPKAEREPRALEMAARSARLPFDLSSPPLLRVDLYRLEDRDYILLVCIHHIVSDGWSMGILVSEINQYYNARVGDDRPSLPELPVEYPDFARWQIERMQTQALAPHLEYWKRRLAGAPPLLSLPVDRPRPENQTFYGALRVVEVPASLKEALVALGKSRGGTLFMVLAAAFQALLSRYSRETDLVIGAPVANRTRPELEGLVGLFVNSLPIRADLSGDPTFLALLDQVRETVMDASAYQDLPLEQIVETLHPERQASYMPLFQVQLVLQNAPLETLRLEGLKTSLLTLDTGVSLLDLTLSVQETAAGLSLTFQYNTDLFDPGTIAWLAAHFLCLLHSAAASPGSRISALEIFPEAERDRVQGEWNPPDPFGPAVPPVTALFAEQAARQPGEIALSCGGRDLTYAELEREASRVARSLVDQGVGMGEPVGLFVERSPEMIAGILGILKAGGAYVPLDPDYPAERLEFVLRDLAQASAGGLPVVLAPKGLAKNLPAGLARLVLFEEEGAGAGEPAQGPDIPIRPQALAYVIYTSGSTGEPRGVCITHAALARSTLARSQVYPQKPERFLLLPSFAFDSSVAGIFWTLCQGGELVLPEQGFQADVDYLAERIAARQVTHLLCLPSLYSLLLEQAGRFALDSLQVVIAAGEQCGLKLARRHAELLAGTAFYNEYGPTEAAVWCSVFRATGREEARSFAVPIGRAIPGAQIYLLDAALRLAPIGATAELYVGGANLAQGYLNHPGLTAEKFVSVPLAPGVTSRLYRTGDLARWRADGNLEFRGRADYQVKVRGYRVELEGIEAVLKSYPSIRQAVAIPMPGETEIQRLAAYISTLEGQKVSLADLRAYLKSRLPAYMLPAVIVILEELPLTPNGKVDRGRLPAPDASRPEIEAPYTAPQTGIELLLASIWEEVLGLKGEESSPVIGVYDSFFDLGGHSLMAAKVMARIQSAFQIRLPLHVLFESPTVAGLAEVIAGRLAEETEAEPSPE